MKAVALVLAIAMAVTGCHSGTNTTVEDSRQSGGERVDVGRAGRLGSSDVAADILCARRIRSQPVCNVDFARLAAFYPYIGDLRMSITGYLVVDNGMLALYATELDYRNQVRGRSIELRIGGEEDLRLFEHLLYRYVNVDGVYSRDFRSNNVRGRLGLMRNPFRAYVIDPRHVDQGIDEVLFSIDEATE